MAVPGQIRKATEYLTSLIRSRLESDGYDNVALILEAPRREIVDSKMPALSLYLRAVDKDEDGLGPNEYIDDEHWVATPVPYRLSYIIAAWANDPREEQVLLESALSALLEPHLVELRAASERNGHWLQLLRQLDDEGLSKFWTSVGQPQRPAIQCSTWADVTRSEREPVARRVESTEVRLSRRVQRL
jgi:hypothetical protein